MRRHLPLLALPLPLKAPRLLLEREDARVRGFLLRAHGLLRLLQAPAQVRRAALLHGDLVREHLPFAAQRALALGVAVLDLLRLREDLVRDRRAARAHLARDGAQRVARAPARGARGARAEAPARGVQLLAQAHLAELARVAVALGRELDAELGRLVVELDVLEVEEVVHEPA